MRKEDSAKIAVSREGRAKLVFIYAAYSRPALNITAMYPKQWVT